jgi:hypothetical protein
MFAASTLLVPTERLPVTEGMFVEREIRTLASDAVTERETDRGTRTRSEGSVSGEQLQACTGWRIGLREVEGQPGAWSEGSLTARRHVHEARE